MGNLFTALGDMISVNMAESGGWGHLELRSGRRLALGRPGHQDRSPRGHDQGVQSPLKLHSGDPSVEIRSA